MARTTIDIDSPILQELKALQKQQQRSLGQLVSQLLAEALASRRHPKESTAALNWISRPMHARVDLSDKEALYAILDEEQS
jgi:hypothetical protein